MDEREKIVTRKDVEDLQTFLDSMIIEASLLERPPEDFAIVFERSFFAL